MGSGKSYIDQNPSYEFKSGSLISTEELDFEALAKIYQKRAERAEALAARLVITQTSYDNLTRKPKPTLTIKESEVFGAKYYDDEGP